MLHGELLLPPQSEAKEAEIKADLGGYKLKELAGKNIVILISVLKGLNGGLEIGPEPKLFESTLFLLNKIQRLLKKKQLPPINIQFVLGGGTGADYPAKRALNEEELKKSLLGLKDNPTLEELLEHFGKSFLPFAQQDEKDYQAICQEHIKNVRVGIEKSKDKEQLCLDYSISGWTQAVSEQKNYSARLEYFKKLYFEDPEFKAEVEKIRDGFLMRGKKTTIIKDFREMILKIRPDLEHINFTEFFDRAGVDFLLKEYAYFSSPEAPTVYAYSNSDINKEFKRAFAINPVIESAVLHFKKEFTLEHIDSQKIVGTSTPFQAIDKPKDQNKKSTGQKKEQKKEPTKEQLKESKKSVIRTPFNLFSSPTMHARSGSFAASDDDRQNVRSATVVQAKPKQNVSLPTTVISPPSPPRQLGSFFTLSDDTSKSATRSITKQNVSNPRGVTSPPMAIPERKTTTPKTQKMVGELVNKLDNSPPEERYALLSMFIATLEARNREQSQSSEMMRQVLQTPPKVVVK